MLHAMYSRTRFRAPPRAYVAFIQVILGNNSWAIGSAAHGVGLPLLLVLLSFKTLVSSVDDLDEAGKIKDMISNFCFPWAHQKIASGFFYL